MCFHLGPASAYILTLVCAELVPRAPRSINPLPFQAQVMENALRADNPLAESEGSHSWRGTAESRSLGDTKDSSVINPSSPQNIPVALCTWGCTAGFRGFYQHPGSSHCLVLLLLHAQGAQSSQEHSSQFKEEPFINEALVHCRICISQCIQGFASQLHKSACWKNCLKKGKKKELNVVSATQPCKQEFLTSCTPKAFYSPYYRGAALLLENCL